MQGGARPRIGIDLGTTNTACAFARAGEVHDFAIPQLVAPGEVAARPTLPSFVYLPAGAELPAGALALPWDRGRGYAVGELARAQGALVPGRLIASAKSWLCHGGVDREAPILPWAAPPELARLSPVEVSARLLAHVRQAWEASHPDAPLGELDVVLTVPASFDEVARELTVRAATQAGLPRLTLVEEPLAAFYAWLHAAGELPPDGLILVCDIGGGTTDFTLIRAQSGALDRVAVGDHLLLGGDNVDLALARRVETRLPGKLDARQLAMLTHQCRLAKEALLAEGAERRDAATVVVSGRGARLVGASLSAELLRTEVLEVVLEGFFPVAAPTDAPTRGRAALAELGLPYAADPAVTRHLADFLRRHGSAPPDAVLFNGGALKASAVRERILDVLASWRGGARPVVLANDAPDLAVARGAAYYGLVRSGQGVRVGGGAARAYYVETEVGQGAAMAVCVLPRGTEEGTEVALPQTFELLVNRPARFRLFSSTERTGDRTGDLVATAGLVELPPIFTALRLGGTSRDQAMPVELHARATEIGTIELACVAKVDGQRWRLDFDLRAGEAARDAAPPPAPEAVAPAPALELVRRTFRPQDEAERIAPDRLVKALEEAFGAARDEWPLAALRALWEPLRDLRGDRGRTAVHEARWLNLAGFCLRPGFGYALDDWRVKELWRVWNAGLVNDGSDACRLEWWILWRRVSGGLSRTQQDEVAKRITPLLLGTGGRKAPPVQEAQEMWRAVSALERIAVETKISLGDALVERLERGKIGLAGWFAVGRLGARVPLYGPASLVVPAKVAVAWVERLLRIEWKNADQAAFALAELARCAGDRARDLDDALRARVAERLRAASGDGPRLAAMVTVPVALESREERFAFGDALPIGIRLAEELAVPPDAM
jgi:molecular chaperone DnaK (HSP70)